MKPLSQLDPLTDDQRNQLADWVESNTYEKAAELARQLFGVEIPRMTLFRFRERLAAKALLDDSPESTSAAAELVRYAATGQQNFAPATLIVLERTAFSLSFVCTQSHEDMRALKIISDILARNRNATVRQRMAAVQEHKCKIREEELKMKAFLQGVPQPSFPAFAQPDPSSDPSFRSAPGTRVPLSSHAAQTKTPEQRAPGRDAFHRVPQLSHTIQRPGQPALYPDASLRSASSTLVPLLTQSPTPVEPHQTTENPPINEHQPPLSQPATAAPPQNPSSSEAASLQAIRVAIINLLKARIASGSTAQPTPAIPTPENHEICQQSSSEQPDQPDHPNPTPNSAIPPTPNQTNSNPSNESTSSVPVQHHSLAPPHSSVPPHPFELEGRHEKVA